MTETSVPPPPPQSTPVFAPLAKAVNKQDTIQALLIKKYGLKKGNLDKLLNADKIQKLCLWVYNISPTASHHPGNKNQPKTISKTMMMLKLCLKR